MDEVELEECWYCKGKYPKPVYLNHTEDECFTNQFTDQEEVNDYGFAS